MVNFHFSWSKSNKIPLDLIKILFVHGQKLESQNLRIPLNSIDFHSSPLNPTKSSRIPLKTHKIPLKSDYPTIRYHDPILTTYLPPTSHLPPTYLPQSSRISQAHLATSGGDLLCFGLTGAFFSFFSSRASLSAEELVKTMTTYMDI